MLIIVSPHPLLTQVILHESSFGVRLCHLFRRLPRVACGRVCLKHYELGVGNELINLIIPRGRNRNCSKVATIKIYSDKVQCKYTALVLIPLFPLFPIVYSGSIHEQNYSIIL